MKCISRQSLFLGAMLFLVGVSCGGNSTDSEQMADSEEQEPSTSQEKDSSTTFSNPLLKTAPDPWVIQDGEKYYVTYTTGTDLILRSTTKMSELANGSIKIVWNPPASGQNSDQIWAPELHKFNGVWYIYYAASDGDNENHRMWVLENTSENPLEGQWTDRGELVLPDDKWAIDGSPVKINEKMYFAWSGWEGDTNIIQDIFIAEMQDPLTIIGERIRLIRPTEDWEKNNVNPFVAEAPQFLEHEGKLFLFYSAGGCWTDGYSIGAIYMDMDNDPLKETSWTTMAENPLFVSNITGNTFGPGHNSFFKSIDGKEDWIFYHANPLAGQGCRNERSARIQKMEWNADGFPILGRPEPLERSLTKPSGE